MHRKSARPRFTLRLLIASPSWLLLAVVLLCPACSGGLNTVRGKVLYQDKPIKGAVVTFHPKGDDKDPALRPMGITDENGLFTLSTQKDAGAAAGEYRVSIRWLEVASASAEKHSGTGQGLTLPVDRLKGQYADPEKSGLTAVIKPGVVNELEPFNLK